MTKRKEQEYAWFPALNKNNTIEEYETQALIKVRRVPLIIEKTVKVDHVTFVGLQHTFLYNNDLWGEIGGADLLPSAKKDNPEMTKKINATDKFWDLTKDEQGFFHKHSGSVVIKVECKDAEKYPELYPFYVNPEGYKYARYVGLSDEHMEYLRVCKYESEAAK